jgi:catechol 2,3-dioxygenase-like lactoylglutathione lyase family enzyme
LVARRVTALLEQEVAMLDHIGVRVRDLKPAKRFYESAMAALDLQVIDNTETSFLIGRSAEQPIPFIWVGTDEPAFWTTGNRVSASPIHIAFSAQSREAVDVFHRAALEAGGSDNGAPGRRGPKEMNYYAASLLIPTATTSRPDSGPASMGGVRIAAQRTCPSPFRFRDIEIPSRCARAAR